MPGSVGDSRGLGRSAFLAHPILLAWGGAIPLRAARGGCPARRIRCNAIASNGWYFSGVSRDIRLRGSRDVGNQRISLPGDSTGSTPCGVAHERQSPDYRAGRGEQRGANFEPVGDACSAVQDPCCHLVPASGSSQFGKAAWYGIVGGRTASGEILDTVTATAAHRSLPLASYAKVTNLDNSRSVVVKINDRGPHTRGRIIDLSPGAADALDMKRAGVVPVVIEPLVNLAAPVVAALQTSSAAVAQ
jgi:rare lipoprotein A